jgi:hypothetical protein
METMQEARRIEGPAFKLEALQIEQLDLSTVPMGTQEEAAEVSAQWGIWIKSPCTGEWWHFRITQLHSGWNLLRLPDGCVFGVLV